jgi:hypothetical protein
MIEIDNTQKNNILKHILSFKKYSKTKNYPNDMKDRKQREEFFSKITKERFLSLNEFDFGEIIAKLWAMRLWTNKEYPIQKMISDKGFDHLKSELATLLYSDSENIEKNFNHASKNIKFLGPASLTELMCYFNPKSYGIWNEKARTALKILGFADVLPLDKYKINGSEYDKFNKINSLISLELIKAGFADSDLLFVDYFLYEVCNSSNKGEQEPVEVKIGIKNFDHDEIRDFISEIGNWLGFETETEKTIGHGARVDTVWRAQIANLGVVNYVFEVHKSGSIDSLIVNLQKSKRNPTVQKIIAVSDEEQLERIKKEITGLPEEFVRSLSYWDVVDVIKTHKNLSDVITSIQSLELVKSEFEFQSLARKSNKK